MLVGREAERSALRDLLARARAGEGGALIVRGEPGMGKSALLADLVDSWGEARLLRTRGVETESPMAFAALHRLLLPLLARVSELPDPQARALARVFGTEDGGEDDRFRVSLGALSLITEAAEEAPVLCVVDDAHWLDDASLAALLFIARRLDLSPVAMVFAVRDGEERTLDAPDLPSITLHGLDVAAAETLLTSVDAALSAPVREALIERTRGNPLALIELPRALTAHQADGAAELPEHLPLTLNLERVFSARASRLSAAGRRFLLLAALEDSGAPAVLAASGRRLGVAEGIDEAVSAGLVELGEDQVWFRHPLVRSAVHAASTPGDRRRAHAALAAAFEEHHDPERAAWHLAAATDLPDEVIAARLDEAGRRMQQRGGHESASAAFERAAQLSGVEVQVGPRLARAALAAWLAGDPVRTRALAQRARAVATDPGLVADLDRLRAFVEMNFGSPRLAHGILAEAGRRAAADGDMGRARQFLMIATALATFNADSGASIDVGRLADTEASEPAEACFSSLLVGLDAVAGARWAEGVPLLRKAIQLAESVDAPDLLTNIGIATLLLGEDELALRWHSRQLDVARQQASVLGVIHALTRRAIQQLAMGSWADLTAANAEVLELATATGHANQRPLPLAQLLVVDAFRGVQDVPGRADVIEQTLRSLPSGILEGLARDTLRWARGVHSAATAPDAALLEFDAIGLPLLRRAAALDIAEAAARAGDRETGERVAADLRSFAAATGMAWAAAYTAHADALLGHEDQREALFEAALVRHRAASRPFFRARTELAYGEHLRRARRRVDARDHLRTALAIFEQLGAEPWALRAAEELRGSGETARRRGGSESGGETELTAQELQVARLVQDGLSNKDAAARLFLSPRTIEFHLRNIFAKLGITSRAALAKLELPTTG